MLAGCRPDKLSERCEVTAADHLFGERTRSKEAMAAFKAFFQGSKKRSAEAS
jgi:hypothetical protein